MNNLKNIVFVSVFVVFSLAFAGCKEAAQNSHSSAADSKASQDPLLDSGISGSATYSAGCGAIPVDPPPGYCAPTPYSSSFDLLACDSNGQNCQFLQKFQTGDDGKFKLLLQAGEYQIQLPEQDPLSGAIFPVASPIQVQVMPHQVTDVQIDVRSSIPVP